ncbi:LPS assembly lipoprotein LptE [Maricaulis sp.]|uniref:LPS assembly lipoprotein LptE n=1 Tax=Maricaulis sp. TaxID=1486257 RepID=UPI00260A7157|nr:LPS assembly lipoprotein LptE [Maricaulis sp.]
MRTSKTASILLTSLVCLALSACGFSPMYGSGSAAHNLSDIIVQTGEERVDFYLQEALLDEMGARNARGPMRLVTRTETNRVGLGISADAVAVRFAVEVRVQYAIMEAGNSDPIMRGNVSAQASYNVASEVYSSVAAQEDAEIRAAQMAAERIVLELARASLTASDTPQ